MSVKVVKKELLDALTRVGGAVPSVDVIPVLTHFLFLDGEIVATDLEIGIVTEFAALKGLDFLVPATKFARLIKRLPQNELVLDLSGDRSALTIEAPGHRSTLVVLPPHEDFPQVKQQFRRWLTVPEDFESAIKSCRYTRNESRGVAFGCISWGEDGMVSSDTLAISWYSLSGAHPDNPVLLSKALVRELVRLGQPDGWVVHGGRIAFNYGDTQLVGSLIDVDFPDRWKKLFPADEPPLIDLGSDVKDSLSRVADFSVDTETAARLTLGDGQMLITAEDVEGSIEETVEVEKSRKQSWDCRVNSGMLAPLLRLCSRGALIDISGRQVLYLVGCEGVLRVVAGVMSEETC